MKCFKIISLVEIYITIAKLNILVPKMCNFYKIYSSISIQFLHFRDIFNQILRAAAVHLCNEITRALRESSMSTGVRPHYWLAAEGPCSVLY